MKILVAFVSGALFALGLALGGMTQPAKVLAFLDVAGRWDPSLAFVMVAAIAVHALAARFALRRPAPLLDTRFQLPTKIEIDRRLVAGAAIFGLGWGIAGYCPGPAIASAGSGSVPAIIVLAAMLAGMMLGRLYEGAVERAESKAPARGTATARSRRLAA